MVSFPKITVKNRIFLVHMKLILILGFRQVILWELNEQYSVNGHD